MLEVLVGFSVTVFTMAAAAVMFSRLHRSNPAALNPPRERRVVGGQPVDVTKPFVGRLPAGIWAVRFPRAALAARTLFQVHEGGALDRHMERLGFRDVRIGDRAFDERFQITGTEPDVVRGVLRDETVRTQLLRLFRITGMQFVSLDPDGSLEVRCRRLADFEEDKALKTALRLFQALEGAASVRPLPPPSDLVAGGTGTASGLPIGIPSSGDE